MDDEPQRFSIYSVGGRCMGPRDSILSIGSRILFSVDEHVRNCSKVQIEVPKIDAIDLASAGGDIYAGG